MYFTGMNRVLDRGISIGASLLQAESYLLSHMF